MLAMTNSLQVLFEDRDLLVVYKSADTLVVSSPWTPASETIVGMARVYAGERIWPVHRLDRDTSGPVLLAKSQEACRSFHHQFESHSIDKVYECIVEGKLLPQHGMIDLPISKGKRWSEAQVGGRGGKFARTEYWVKEHCGPATWVKVRPMTGRFHQIRAHLAAKGHPLAHDPIYYKNSPWGWLRRVPLHCTSISFDHPKTGRRITIECPWPPDLQEALNRFRRGG